ncbi:hypothetical protein GW17_00014346 [Ensete ventricosum]|nr:hypothetical protein GW17_00014346 [Ensete ventricosum]
MRMPTLCIYVAPLDICVGADTDTKRRNDHSAFASMSTRIQSGERGKKDEGSGKLGRRGRRKRRESVSLGICIGVDADGNAEHRSIARHLHQHRYRCRASAFASSSSSPFANADVDVERCLATLCTCIYVGTYVDVERRHLHCPLPPLPLHHLSLLLSLLFLSQEAIEVPQFHLWDSTRLVSKDSPASFLPTTALFLPTTALFLPITTTTATRVPSGAIVRHHH